MAGPPHRSVSSLKPLATVGEEPATPTSPQTPRSLSVSNPHDSPFRDEDEIIVVEVGSRYLRVGFAGDLAPQVVIGFGPEEQRRAGDYRQWQRGYDTEWRKRAVGKEWGGDRELWKLDLRTTDLDLFRDKIDRALREAIMKYLLLDYRPKMMILVLPSHLPVPIVTTLLDTIFTNFQTPTISLFVSPLLTTIAAGLRAALVIDIGWAETVATAIYEYREVQSHRTIRARKFLAQEMLEVLGKNVPPTQHHMGESKVQGYKKYVKAVSFEECEEVVGRVAWCKPSKHRVVTPSVSKTLPSVEEENEVELSMGNMNINDATRDPHSIEIPLRTTQPPMTLKLPFSTLAEPCEKAFFADGTDAVQLDDDELPLHLLVYQTLLRLPVDVRSACMSRLVFTGSASMMPGLKNRICDEVEALIRARQWDPVLGKAAERVRHNEKLNAGRSRQVNSGPVPFQGEDISDHPAFKGPEPDNIEEKLKREAQKGKLPPVQGTMRIVESMGAWVGAGMLARLKVAPYSVIDREQWFQEGVECAITQDEIYHAYERYLIDPRTPRPVPPDWTLGPWGD